VQARCVAFYGTLENTSRGFRVPPRPVPDWRTQHVQEVERADSWCWRVQTSRPTSYSARTGRQHIHYVRPECIAPPAVFITCSDLLHVLLLLCACVRVLVCVRACGVRARVLFVSIGSRREVPVTSYGLHEMACARYSWRCEECGAVLPLAEKDKHRAVAHVVVRGPVSPMHCLGLTCESRLVASQAECACGVRLPPEAMQVHREFECPKRMVGCLYCSLEVPFDQRGEHQGVCGNRTVTCSLCHTRHKRNGSTHPPSRIALPHTASANHASSNTVPCRAALALSRHQETPGGGAWGIPPARQHRLLCRVASLLSLA
jgi:hypothetical protein